MRNRTGAALLALALASTLAACTGSAGPARPEGHPAGHPASRPAAAAPTPTPTSFVGHPLGTNGRPGAPGCQPASPVSAWKGYLPQVEGTGHGATLWGLVMLTHPLPAQVGDQVKIVWRMTGTGPLTVEAIAPGGGAHPPFWGPEAHGSSNWDKPGDEWGTGYVFTSPGCWDLRATRGKATADVWLEIAPR